MFKLWMREVARGFRLVVPNISKHNENWIYEQGYGPIAVVTGGSEG